MLMENTTNFNLQRLDFAYACINLLLFAARHHLLSGLLLLRPGRFALEVQILKETAVRL